jgi:glycosyltransferase involved in cell wall biosynthesis
VRLLPAVSRDALAEAYRRADLFVLTPFVTESGDRDGIPNVLVEAMACGLPVVATAAGGIPELVDHGGNGLLAEPRDVGAVTSHVACLLEDRAAREQLGAGARATVLEHFDDRQAAASLALLLADREPVSC